MPSSDCATQANDKPNRANEPDTYWIVVRESLPRGAGRAIQQQDYLERRQKNRENMTQESSNRADIVEVKSSSLPRAFAIGN